MAEFRIAKVTALPGTLTAHTVYLVAPPARPDFVEMYVTGASPSTVKRMLREQDVADMIAAAVDGLSSIEVVANIAARDALVLTANTQVLVLDATGDPTVASGAATYVWRAATSTWTKISEAESLDVQIQWSSIIGRPSSSPALIDNAVALRHTHTNKTQLDKIGEDADGNLTYDGDLPVTGWTEVNW